MRGTQLWQWGVNLGWRSHVRVLICGHVCICVCVCLEAKGEFRAPSIALFHCNSETRSLIEPVTQQQARMAGQLNPGDPPVFISPTWSWLVHIAMPGFYCCCWLVGWVGGWVGGWVVGWLVGWLVDWGFFCLSVMDSEFESLCLHYQLSHLSGLCRHFRISPVWFWLLFVLLSFESQSH